MSQNEQVSQEGMEQAEAELLARHFNVTFNNVTVYGGTHPSFLKTVTELIASINQAFSRLPLITIMVERDSVYVEQWCVNKRVSQKKIVMHFIRAGIESISFRKGVTDDEVKEFMGVIGNTKIYPTVDAMKDALQKKNVEKGLLNYVAYQKVTLDETVIDKADEAAPGNASFDSTLLGQMVMDEFSQAFSLKQYLDNSEQISQDILAKGFEKNDGRYIAGQIKQFGQEIEGNEEGNEPASMDNILEAVVKLKKDLHEGIDIQKELGKVLNHEGEVLNELDQLTHQVIVKLVKEEYLKGKVSIKRLAQIIRRLIPNSKEIKRVLPSLKDALIEAGMKLADFLDLITELGHEPQEEGLIGALKQGAEEWGLSIDEIIKEIKNDPQEAAKLIILAAEIKEGVKDDQDQLSEFLTDYIEKISTKMAMDVQESSDQMDNQAVKTLLSNFEGRILKGIKGQGLQEDVLEQIEKRLSERFEKALNRFQSDWVLKEVKGSGDALPTPALLNKLGKVVDQETDLANFKDSLIDALEDKGFSPEQIKNFYNSLTDRIANKGKEEELSDRILSNANINLMLQQEILRSLRYHDPFSCLVISVARIINTATNADITEEGMDHVMPQVYNTLAKNLRDTDLVGKLKENIPLIILTKIEREKTIISKKRIFQKLSRTAFHIGEEKVKVDFTISHTHFDKSITQNLKAYIKLVETQHHYQAQKTKKANAM